MGIFEICFKTGGFNALFSATSFPGSLFFPFPGRKELRIEIACLHNKYWPLSKIRNGNWTEWSTIQGVVGRVVGRFEITSSITSELYDTKSSYQLIVSITKCENRKSTCPSGYIFKYQFCKQWRNSCKKNQFQCTRLTRAQRSCSNWTAVIGHPRDNPPITYQIGARRANHNRAFCYRYDYGRNWLTWLSLLSAF